MLCHPLVQHAYNLPISRFLQLQLQDKSCISISGKVGDDGQPYALNILFSQPPPPAPHFYLWQRRETLSTQSICSVSQATYQTKAPNAKNVPFQNVLAPPNAKNTHKKNQLFNPFALPIYP